MVVTPSWGFVSMRNRLVVPRERWRKKMGLLRENYPFVWRAIASPECRKKAFQLRKSVLFLVRVLDITNGRVFLIISKLWRSQVAVDEYFPHDVSVADPGGSWGSPDTPFDWAITSFYSLMREERRTIHIRPEAKLLVRRLVNSRNDQRGHCVNVLPRVYCFETVVESFINSFKTIWAASVLTSFVTFHKTKHELCLFLLREKVCETPISFILSVKRSYFPHDVSYFPHDV